MNSARGDVSFCKLISVGDRDEEQRDGLVVDGLNEEEEEMDGYRSYRATPQNRCQTVFTTTFWT